jgi:hypothetical protein
MKTWDLTAGAGKLEMALETLHTANVEVEKYWNDEANHKFQEIYIVPLKPKVRALLEAIERLAEVLDAADRHCGRE